jgi:hypothetical protein
MQDSFSNKSDYHPKPLGTYLVDAGLLSPGQVEVILADQQQVPMSFGEIASARGWIKQETVEYLMQKVVLPERIPAVKPAPSSSNQTSPSPQNVYSKPVFPPNTAAPKPYWVEEQEEISWSG